MNNDPLLGAFLVADNEIDDDEEVTVLPDVTPSVPPCPSHTDSLIAKQMTRLSIEDREKVYHDLHGISDEVEETHMMIMSSLVELEAELRCIANKGAYETALSMNPEYVQHPDFRLMFLRADRFDAKQAALRLARHFQAKLDLFGRDKLAKDIVQDDLDIDDMEALYSGFTQHLPFRDRAGRVVWIYFATAQQQSLKVKSKVSFKMENGRNSSVSVVLILCLLVAKNVLHGLCVHRGCRDSEEGSCRRGIHQWISGSTSKLTTCMERTKTMEGYAS
jgi:hypothetical protein